MSNIVQHKNPARTGKTRVPGLSGTALKWIAAAAMLCESAAVLRGGQDIIYQIMRLFGQMSAPIICFLLCEGYHRTQSQRKYGTRLLVLGLAAYLIHRFFAPIAALDDIVFPLLLTYISLCIYGGVQMPYSFRLPVIAMLAWWAQQTCPDGAAAILFTLSFEIARTYGTKMQTMAGLLAALCCLLSVFRMLVLSPQTLLSDLWRLGILLSLIPIAFYNGERGGGKAAEPLKWFFYIFYPAHLIVLGILCTAS